jgi:hypothetical protein
MRIAAAAPTVDGAMFYFTEELARQKRQDLERRARTAYRFEGVTVSRGKEQRRLRRRAVSAGVLRGWRGALALLHPRTKRAA